MRISPQYDLPDLRGKWDKLGALFYWFNWFYWFDSERRKGKPQAVAARRHAIPHGECDIGLIG